MLQAYAARNPLLHDACPIAWLLAPELFKGEYGQLEVDTSPTDMTGHLTWACRDAPAIETGTPRVHLAVQATQVLRLVRDSLQILP